MEPGGQELLVNLLELRMEIEDVWEREDPLLQQVEQHQGKGEHLERFPTG